MRASQTILTMATLQACSFLLAGPRAAAEDPRTLLFYGNSFTLGIGSTEAQSLGGVPGVFSQLAIAAGHPAPDVENAAVSGQTLTWHLANNTAVIANPVDFVPAPGFQWDHVVLQGFSTGPTHIGNLAQFRSDLLALYSLVRTHSPGASAVLFETWAPAPGHSFYTGASPELPGGPAQMQQELRDGYDLARQDVDAAFGANTAAVAPIGDTWESTNWDNLHSSDLWHAGPRGTYLTALVIFGTVYDEPTYGLPKVFASLTDQEAAALQVAADTILGFPCGLTGPDCNSNCVPDEFEDDCNGNGIPDDCDIAGHTSSDCNTNALPDDCEMVVRLVWSDDFESDTAAAWTTVAKDAGDHAVFHFDYSTRSIPPAPNSAGGTTRGLFMEANTTAGPADASGICAYPIGQNFSGDLVLTWDMYISWDSGGSTEHHCTGINHDGTRLNASAAVTSDTDGVFFASASDGDVSQGASSVDGSIKDYNRYWGSPGAAPIRGDLPQWDNNQALFGALFPTVTGDPVGASRSGSPGRQWVTGEISQIDGIITWRLNGEIISQAVNGSGFDSGSIMLGFFDHFSGQNTTGNAFIIYDNVRVSVPLDASDALVECLNGPCPSPPCYPPALGMQCCLVDEDADDDVDLLDFQRFQVAFRPPLPQLGFSPQGVSFSLESGPNQDNQNVTVTTSDASSTTVTLSAVDDATQSPPTWLTVAATHPTATPLPIQVDATGLSLGSHTATLTAAAGGYVEAQATVDLTVTASPTDSTILIDLGSASTPTSGAPRHWNNVHTGNMTTTVPLNNVTNTATGVSLVMSPALRFNASNSSGTTTPPAGSDIALRNYPASATQDSLFGNDVEFSGGTYPTAQMVLTGLSAAAAYNLTFCASRMGAGDNRTTDYQVDGATSTTVSLDAAGNDSDVVTVDGMTPNVQGEITITVTKGAGNNNSFGFYYLGIIELQEHLP